MEHNQVITQLLAQTSRGDADARERLWALVYEEMHRMAARQLAGEGRWSRRQATSLVSDAFLRIVGPDGSNHFGSRRHFFAAAANAMRRIRVDDARMRLRLKRGAGRPGAELTDDLMSVTENPELQLALDEALTRLEGMDRRTAEVVSLRFHAGRTRDEIAELLGISPSMVDKEWYAARAWLHRELSGE